MLIDANHPEEMRVVVTNGNRLEEFDFETSTKKQLKGNIYLAKVTRVEPSLQAAFVDYGGNRNGFLAFSEIHPDYFQIPLADREALVREVEKAAREDAEREARADAGEGPEIEEVGGSDVDDIAAGGASRRRLQPHRQYKIQEVIKKRQLILVQVAKEERGTKGAALTSYISLAGRYCVLMPNTPNGGGISRKISDARTRKKLRETLTELGTPAGMSVVLRTAGAERTKTEIKRDYEYLSRLWDDIRERTLSSRAPALIYEEADIIKRSIRDIYSNDIDELLVEGGDGYRAAKEFMRMLMPSRARLVKQYGDRIPLFHRYQVETQLASMHSPTVRLPSGGYVVINQTEALVAIDVNSGRSTRERNIEETALKTNLEAADEVARQLRLRDLAGLIVIDFIDMDDRKNNRAVERRLKEAMKADRARIQLGRISGFGLLELSRQRLRPSLIEASTMQCPHCGGTGLVRSVESTALAALRAVEEEGIRERTEELVLRVPTEVALYIFNHKRDMLADIEARYVFRVVVEAADNLTPPMPYELERTRQRKEGEIPERPATAERPVTAESSAAAADADAARIAAEVAEAEAEEEAMAEEEAAAEARSEAAAEPRPEADSQSEEERNRRKRRRRSRRRKRRDDETLSAAEGDDQTDAEGDDQDETDGETDASDTDASDTGASDTGASGTEAVAGGESAEEARTAEENGRRRRRRRRRRPGNGEARTDVQAADDDNGDGDADAADDAVTEAEAEAPVAEASVTEAPAAEAAEAEEGRGRRRRRRRRQPDVDAVAEVEAVAEAEAAPAPVSDTAPAEAAADEAAVDAEPVEAARADEVPAEAAQAEDVEAEDGQAEDGVVAEQAPAEEAAATGHPAAEPEAVGADLVPEADAVVVADAVVAEEPVAAAPEKPKRRRKVKAETEAEAPAEAEAAPKPSRRRKVAGTAADAPADAEVVAEEAPVRKRATRAKATTTKAATTRTAAAKTAKAATPAKTTRTRKAKAAEPVEGAAAEAPKPRRRRKAEPAVEAAEPALVVTAVETGAEPPVIDGPAAAAVAEAAEAPAAPLEPPFREDATTEPAPATEPTTATETAAETGTDAAPQPAGDDEPAVTVIEAEGAPARPRRGWWASRGRS
jgi:ribonuclease E